MMIVTKFVSNFKFLLSIIGIKMHKIFRALVRTCVAFRNGSNCHHVSCFIGKILGKRFKICILITICFISSGDYVEKVPHL